MGRSSPAGSGRRLRRFRRRLAHAVAVMAPRRPSPTPASPPATARKPHRRGLVRVVAALSAALFFGFCALGLGAFVLIQQGALSLSFIDAVFENAIEGQLPPGHRVKIGETLLMRDAEGRFALNHRDVVVRGPDGAIVARAPQAVVALDGPPLLALQVRAIGLDLVGASMTVTLADGGRVVIEAGQTEKPLVEAVTPLDEVPPEAVASVGLLGALTIVADTFEAIRGEKGAFPSVRLANATLTVDDRRSGRKITFPSIDLVFDRRTATVVGLTLRSGGADGLWALEATVTHDDPKRRVIDMAVRDLSPKDLMLATGMMEAQWSSDMPLTGRMTAVLAPGGLEAARIELLAGAGTVTRRGDEDNVRVVIDEALAVMVWDPAERAVRFDPVQLHAGAEKISLRGLMRPPGASDPTWRVEVAGGRLEVGTAIGAPVVLDRVAALVSIAPEQGRIVVDIAEVVGPTAGLAVKGALDLGAGTLALGASAARMPLASLEKLWPKAFAPGLRRQIIDRIGGGMVERAVVSVAAPLATLGAERPRLTERELFVEVALSGATLKPLDGAPGLREAEVTAQLAGAGAAVRIARGTAEFPRGGRIAITDGVFEVQDVFEPVPTARVRARLEASTDAAIELLSGEPFRGLVRGLPDPAQVSGTVAGTVSASFPMRKDNPRGIGVDWTAEGEIRGFVFERAVRGQRLEAPVLKVSSTPALTTAVGDMRLAGATGRIEMRRTRTDTEAELRLQGSFDDAARGRLGIVFGPAVTGPVGVRASLRLPETPRETRVNFELDLTPTKLTEALPGWSKPAGRAARATFGLTERPQGAKIEDLVLESAGISVKGALELDADGDIVTASLPVFHMGEGDKAALTASRGDNGAVKLLLRGDLVDGRTFLRGATDGTPAERAAPRGGQPRRPRDVEIEMRVGALVGFNGEVARQVNARFTRREGRVTAFEVDGRLGRDGRIEGDIRPYRGRPSFYLASSDAGALMRFLDLYGRIHGGSTWIALEPPGSGDAGQDGVIVLRDFTIRGEAALERAMASVPAPDGSESRSGGPAARVQQQPAGAVQFERLRAEFSRTPGRLTVREGIISGPAVGATFDGTLDYAANRVLMRGTLVPAYALNNLFARLPVLGPLLGGGSANEGLIGITYEVSGPTSGPVMRVNPISAVAPGFFRRIFDFRGEEEGRPVPER